jgi:hypothetical protein
MTLIRSWVWDSRSCAATSMSNKAGEKMFKRFTAVLSMFLAIMIVSGGSASAAWPQFGISQSFRNFGLKTDEGAYTSVRDVTKSPFWSPLNITRLRVIVPFDLAYRAESDGRRQEFEHWLARADELNAEPYVVLGPSELTTNVVEPKTYPKAVNRIPAGDINAPNELVAPLVNVYRAAFSKFLDTWGPGTPGDVRLIGAWNEPNVEQVSQSLPGGAGSARVYLPANESGGYSTEHSMGHPKSSEEPFYARIKNCTGSSSTWTVYNCGPRMAAYYWASAVEEMWKIPAKCAEGSGSCQVVAGEFASRPKHEWYWDKYSEQLGKVAGFYPTVISFHGHNDAKPLGQTECTGTAYSKCITTTFHDWLRAQVNGIQYAEIWDTEVGAEFDSGESPSSTETAQNNRFNYMLGLSESNEVSRIYYFNFWGGGTDRGLIESSPETTVFTKPRKIWETIRCKQAAPETCPSFARPPVFADVTGDGKSDAITVGSAGITVRTSTGSGLNAPQSWTTEAFLGDRDNYFADVTGDGKADAIVVNRTSNYIQVRPSNGSSFGAAQTWSTSAFLGDRGNYFADVTGDGKADAIRVRDEATKGVFVRRSTGSGFSTTEETWTSGVYLGDRGNYFADVTGDGKADAIVVNSNQNYVVIRRSTGNGFEPNEAWSTGAYYGDRGNYFADVTGDGKADAIVVNEGASYVVVRPSNGTAFEPNQTWSTTQFFGSMATAFADLTGDKKADIAAASSGQGLQVRASTGSAFGAASSWSTNPFYGVGW